MKDMLKTPVLLIVYNRLTPTKQVFSQIRKVKPQKLYIACDGYKKNKAGDQTKVEEVRQWLLGAVDWKCQIATSFAEENRGCKYGVAHAIDWVFENEEEAIILEDDIVADESFFWFCQDMLERYKEDERIMTICGHKAVWDFPIDDDYFFTAFGPVWGWATWKRAWNYFDNEMIKWPYFKEKKILAQLYGKDSATSLTESLDLTYSKKLNSWAYAWDLARIINSGLGILPKTNLIQNVGYGSDATHSSGREPDFHRSSLDLPVKPVENVIRNWEYDRMHAKKFVSSRRVHRFIRKFIPKRILKRWYRFRGVKV